MPEYPIKLGMKADEKFGPSEIERNETIFPSLFLEWEKDYELPESGEMKIRFKKRAETNSERNGKTRQTVELDITEILDVSKSKGETREEDREEMLDKLREEVEKEKKNEEE